MCRIDYRHPELPECQASCAIRKGTSSGAHLGSDRDGFRAIVMQRFKEYRICLDVLLTELKNRFEPWPEWLELSFNAFQRKESLTSLLESPFDIHPLTNDVKKSIDAEYVTLHRNALKIIQELQSSEGEVNINRVWYQLLTEEIYHQHCTMVNRFALRFLNRSFNECIVESEVSSLEDIH